MKIAALSDIHGNLDALESVINDIDDQGADKIYICGDLAMAGPEPAETMDYIIELTKTRNVLIIQGNTDEMIIKSTGSPDDKYTPPNEIMASSLEYAQKILRPDHKEFLYELPKQLTDKVGELEILLVHGSPRRNSEDIFPNIPIEEVKTMISGTSADIIFCGHTHIPVTYRVGKQTVINVGSVGRPFTGIPSASYVIIEYPASSEEKFMMNYRTVPYNHVEAANKLAKLPFKGAERLSKLLIKAASRYP